MPGSVHQQILRCTLVGLLSSQLTGCFMMNFFKHKNSSNGDSTVFTGTVLGQPLGVTAGGANEAALAQVYAVATTHAPAAVRPDPDTYVRSLLLQYRPEGDTVAQQIGQVEQYAPLLGGASEDFSTTPQKTYDATSLLAVSTVANQVCQGLVAPDPYNYPGWSTILPLSADQEQANIAWLAQRLTGRPTTSLDPTIFPALTSIMTAAEPSIAANWWANGNPTAKYIPVCAALLMSADAMYY